MWTMFLFGFGTCAALDLILRLFRDIDRGEWLEERAELIGAYEGAVQELERLKERK